VALPFHDAVIGIVYTVNCDFSRIGYKHTLDIITCFLGIKHPVPIGKIPLL